MKIRFLGQSGYILKSGNTEIIIDHYLSDSVNRVAGRPRDFFRYCVNLREGIK